MHKDEDPRDYRVSFEKIAAVLGYASVRKVGDGVDEVIRLLESRIIEDPHAPVYRN